ncbi:Crp/Fnr family transcriptional regulator [Mangrovivirga sp. M17]|uniref:Crp/Fnr family transcriptional regulator n=1 Tax=Mangrovivirga halotolerans TaxID=2993936 RepID=A0ABT3RUW2_9BACT|nr:Crp/Fnr family transcriptional regulator [Mangrovivirga halotolerans]MCX2745559.1 Crp/Fnr family transcriptional regulator [Mangrovivirga halotolerans]
MGAIIENAIQPHKLLRDFFGTEHPENREGLEDFISSFKVTHFKKGDIILKEGQSDKTLRFLTSGSIRDYYQTEIKDSNIFFYTTPQFCTDLNSFQNNIPSKKNQECLTSVTLLSISKTTFSEFISKYNCGKSFLARQFEKILAYKEKAEYNRITKDPEQLYEQLLVNKKEWLNKIPQYHIASYLGVTPETLSRIRKRIS